MDKVEEKIEDTEKGGDDYNIVKLMEESINPPKEGDVVKGTIVKITPQEVYIDIGSKSEGVAHRAEFKDLEIEVNQEVIVYIETIDGKDGRTIVSKHKADFLKAWDKVKEAYTDNRTLEVKVLRQVKGGLVVDVMGVDAFLPGSQLDVKKVRSIASFINKTIPVKVIKLNKLRKNIVVSRKEVIEEDLEKAKEKLSQLKPGDIIEGVVKNTTDFGAFVDIGGIDGLIHISDLAWYKVEKTEDIVKPGDKVKAYVLEVDPQNLKLALSIKHLVPHPWEDVPQKFPIGATVEGVVRNIVDYGVFVEIAPGVKGLVHLSEMVWGMPPKHPSEVVKEGDKVDVVILDIDMEKQRISLGMKEAKPDPWSIIEEKYPVDSIVKGTVKEFGNYGAYIEIEDGIDGFLHIGDISWTQKFSKPQDALRKGQKLRLKILNVDKRNRLLELGLKQLRTDPWEEIQKRLPQGTQLKATITAVSERGITVEVDKGLEGFVSQSHLEKKGDPRNNYNEGEELNLLVTKIEPQKKRVLLSEKEYYKAKEMEEVAQYKSEPAKINLGEILKSELERIENIDEETEEKK